MSESKDLKQAGRILTLTWFEYRLNTCCAIPSKKKETILVDNAHSISNNC